MNLHNLATFNHFQERCTNENLTSYDNFNAMTKGMPQNTSVSLTVVQIKHVKMSYNCKLRKRLKTSATSRCRLRSAYLFLNTLYACLA